MKRHLIRFLMVPHLVLVALLLLSALAVTTYLRSAHLAPLRGELATLETENRRHTRELANLRELVELSDQAKSVAEQLNTLDRKTTGKPSQSVLVSELNALVRRSNVTVLHGDNRSKLGQEGANWFLQELSIEGDYPNIRYFLELLMAYERLLVIEEIDWKVVKSGRQKTRLKLATLFREAS